MQKKNGLFRIDYIIFPSAADAAYAKKLVRQAIEDAEDDSKIPTAVPEAHDWLQPDAMSDVPDTDDYQAEVDTQEGITDPNERRLEISGRKTELQFNWIDADMIQKILGQVKPAEFGDSVQPLMSDMSRLKIKCLSQDYNPEFTSDMEREKAWSEPIKMHQIMGLEDVAMVEAY
ncbi:hypothetical protein GGR50DRAFT_136741 [Xylaria sp. CBS 124048]|nr:hypothetical protein GGR50DRAFT_136741 [Xylaria sp. CBS 124048]